MYIGRVIWANDCDDHTLNFNYEYTEPGGSTIPWPNAIPKSARATEGELIIEGICTNGCVTPIRGQEYVMVLKYKNDCRVDMQNSFYVKLRLQEVPGEFDAIDWDQELQLPLGALGEGQKGFSSFTWPQNVEELTFWGWVDYTDRIDEKADGDQYNRDSYPISAPNNVPDINGWSKLDYDKVHNRLTMELFGDDLEDDFCSGYVDWGDGSPLERYGGTYPDPNGGNQEYYWQPTHVYDVETTQYVRAMIDDDNWEGHSEWEGKPVDALNENDSEPLNLSITPISGDIPLGQPINPNILAPSIGDGSFLDLENIYDLNDLNNNRSKYRIIWNMGDGTYYTNCISVTHYYHSAGTYHPICSITNGQTGVSGYGMTTVNAE